MRNSISQIRDFHVFSWAGALFSWPFRAFFVADPRFRVFRVFSWAGSFFSWSFRVFSCPLPGLWVPVAFHPVVLG